MPRSILELALSLAIAVLTVGSLQAADKYVLSAENTKIEFVGSKKDGKHTGGFKKLEGDVSNDGTAWKITVMIDTPSIYSDNEKLTGHLKSGDFFAIKDHPTAKFESTKIAKGEDGYTVSGNLTLLGKTKAVTFPAAIATGKDFTLKAAFKIDRSDFGMTYGEGKIDNEVKIDITVSAKKS